MQQETFRLLWKHYNSNLEISLKKLYSETNYSDVTLVSDDKISMSSHKFVLSACSPVLRTLLLNNSHSHPILYLRGIKHQELLSILQFIYLGEARVEQHRLDNFINTGRDLQIKEFMQESTNELAHIQDFDDTLGKQDVLHTVTSPLPELFTLDDSEETSKVEGNKVHTCKSCEAVYKDKSSLRLHQESKHEGIRYPCNQCEFQSTSKGNFKIHQQGKHENIKYSCDECQFQSSQPGNLNYTRIKFIKVSDILVTSVIIRQKVQTP